MKRIFCDWGSNKNNIKGRLILIAFRLAHSAKGSRVLFIILLPHLILYRLIVEWFLGFELPWKTEVGAGLTLYHGQSTVINDGSIIGENCIIRHCVTVGNKQLWDRSFSLCPIVGNNVDIGSNVCIIGPVKIGNNVIIGAGSVVVKDIPDNVTIVGNPSRIIKQNL